MCPKGLLGLSWKLGERLEREPARNLHLDQSLEFLLGAMSVLDRPAFHCWAQ